MLADFRPNTPRSRGPSFSASRLWQDVQRLWNRSCPRFGSASCACPAAVAPEVQDSIAMIPNEKTANARPKRRSGARKIEFIVTSDSLKLNCSLFRCLIWIPKAERSYQSLRSLSQTGSTKTGGQRQRQPQERPRQFLVLCRFLWSPLSASKNSINITLRDETADTFSLLTGQCLKVGDNVRSLTGLRDPEKHVALGHDLFG